MSETTTATCPKCGSASYNRQSAGSICPDCNHRELDEQTSPGWTRVAIGKCFACGTDFGTRACPIGVVTSLDDTCTKCGIRRSSTLRWALGRVDPLVISSDRPAIPVRT